MIVNLLTCTPNPELTVASIAKICYNGDHTVDYWMNNMSYDDVEKMITNLIASHHMSPFEHISFTFEIDEISRACSHQLVRHRIASYTQRSQRYTEADPYDVVYPTSIAKDGEAIEDYVDALDSVRDAYKKFIALGIPKEDARYILPEGSLTNIVVTMNARELMHFFECRCCNRAQWEIRGVANKMLKLTRQAAPLIFKDAGAPCSHGECPEGSHSCGEQC